MGQGPPGRREHKVFEISCFHTESKDKGAGSKWVRTWRSSVEACREERRGFYCEVSDILHSERTELPL